MLDVIAYQNSENKESYTIYKGDVEFDLNAAGVTRIEVTEEGKSIDSDGQYVSFSGSVVNIAWGKLGVIGETDPTIWAYSADYPNGVVLLGPQDGLKVNVVKDERESFNTFLVVEDGTGLHNSNSYLSVAESNTFANMNSNTSWTQLSDARKEELLHLATTYVDSVWGERFKGYPLTIEQALEFPRSKCFDRYGRALVGVPSTLKHAVYCYAVSAKDKPLWASDSNETSVEVKKKSVTVGPIKTDTEYIEGKSSNSRLYFPKADSLMKKLLSYPSGGVIRN